MEEFAFARLLHVIGVVLWIGGVAFVTTVLLPAVRRMTDPSQRLSLFDAVERRFAWQARITTLLTGLSGFWMTAMLDGWKRFAMPSYWWMSAMVLVWLLFTLMLFVLEPLVLHRWFEARSRRDAEGTFRLVERLHRVLLTVSLVTVAGAVAGSHGWLLAAP